jgi:hydroxymethylbilane synthase
MHSPLRIGTRGSQLALWQARAVATLLEASGVPAELVIVKTTGDRLQDAPLSEAGGKRLFVKEIEDALLNDEVDVAVHSAKDLPAVLPEDLDIAATLPREDPRDVLVLPADAARGDAQAVLAQLAAGQPRIGTSSVRRIAQLAPHVPGAAFTPIRGNVDTRLRKLDRAEYDALVLAAAGIRRLGLGDRISAALPPEICIPAPGQGIIAIEIRSRDDQARQALRALHDASAALAAAVNCRSARSPCSAARRSTCTRSCVRRTARTPYARTIPHPPTTPPPWAIASQRTWPHRERHGSSTKSGNRRSAPGIPIRDSD